MRPKFKFTAVIAVLITSMLACSMPGSLPGTRLTSPTPNTTLTALFAPPVEPSVTNTLPPPTQTDTPVASNTPEPPTNTPEPTKKPTRAATQTNTPIPARGGTLYVANYFSTPPVMDGVWGEWTAKQYPIPYVVYGKGNWTGEDDLGAAFRVAWDSTYLYLAFKIGDDTYVQNATGQNIFKGDSLELLIDTDLYGDFANTGLNSDDYQLGIAFGKPDIKDGTREAYLWNPSNVAGSRSQVNIAASQGDKVYRVEVAVPWSMLGVNPGAGMAFGFAVSVSDDDTPGSQEQQTMISSAANRNFLKPTTWGEVVLGR